MDKEQARRAAISMWGMMAPIGAPPINYGYMPGRQEEKETMHKRYVVRGRIGGQELTVVVYGATEEDALYFAQREFRASVMDSHATATWIWIMSEDTINECVKLLADHAEQYG